MCCIVEEEEDKNMKWLKLLVQWVLVGREQCNLNCVENQVSKLQTLRFIKNNYQFSLSVMMIPV